MLRDFRQLYVNLITSGGHLLLLFVGFQIESNSQGVRDNAASRAKFAKALFNAVRDYLGAQFELKLPVAPGGN